MAVSRLRKNIINILFYDGSESSGIREKRPPLDSMLRTVLGAENFTYYRLSSTTSPLWTDYTRLLVLCGDIEDEIAAASNRYLTNGGAILSIDSNFQCCGVTMTACNVSQQTQHISLTDNTTVELALCERPWYFTEKHSDREMTVSYPLSQSTEPHPVVRVDTDSGGLLLYCQLCRHHLHRPDYHALLRWLYTTQFDLQSVEESVGGSNPQAEHNGHYPTAYLIGEWSQNDLRSVVSSEDSAASQRLFLRVPNGECSDVTPSCDVILPLERPTSSSAAASALELLGFDSRLYWSLLRTKQLGRRVLLAPEVGSSQQVARALLSHGSAAADADVPVHGVAIVAQRQTSGRGRGGTVWISPSGCCMFTLVIGITDFTTTAASAAKLCWLQHLASLAVCLAVDCLAGSKWPSSYSADRSPLRIKWPNDVYWQERVKIGGVVVESHVQGGGGGGAVAIVGVGVNLSNDRPIVSLNRLLLQHCQPPADQHVGEEVGLRPEAMLAETFNQLERLLFEFEREPQLVRKLYCSRWLHSEQPVTVCRQQQQQLQRGSGQEEATVCGVDEFGYLRVRFVSGRVATVSPDGNSFDMMRGLIVPKLR